MEIRNSPFLQLFYYLKSVKMSNLFSEDISFAEYVMLELIAAGGLIEHTKKRLAKTKRRATK